MRLQAALVGNLEEVMRDEIERGARAVSLGTDRTVTDLKLRLRAQVVAAFGSQKLANSWRGNTYPRLPQTSLGAAGTVYSNAPHIIEAFSAATVVRSKAGFFLAIPSPDCPRENGRRRVTPSNWNDARYGRLRFVYRPGKASLLVVDSVTRTKSGRVGRRLANDGLTSAGNLRKGSVSVVMFFLVPFVRLKQVFRLDAEYERAAGAMVGNIIAAWRE